MRTGATPAADVLFRVDAGRTVGSGHFVRCRLLARALREDGLRSCFVTATPENSLVAEARREDFPVVPLEEGEAVDAAALALRADEHGRVGSVIVVDDHRTGFHDLDFQRGIRRAGLGLMMISFRREPHFVADIVHNQNLLALEHEYSVEDHTTLLRGPRYAVLDGAYRALRPERPSVPDEVEEVLVTFGGGDHTGQTRKVVDGVARARPKLRRAIVVVGAMYPEPGELRRHLDGLAALESELHVNTSRMPELMARADLAVSSGGLTAWELACLGVPNVVLSTAETQRETGRLLHRRDCVHYLGHHDEVTAGDVARCVSSLSADRERRRRLCVRSRDLVDGRGTERVIRHVRELAAAGRAA